MNIIIILSSIILLMDQLIKIIVDQNMFVEHSIPIISDFFSLTYVRNYGAAFSMMNGNRFFLIVVAILALFFIYHFWIQNQILSHFEKITYGLFIGGIIGNLLDRIFRGYVIDYLDFSILKYQFPIFNLADIMIVISILFLVIIMLRGEKYGRNHHS